MVEDRFGASRTGRRLRDLSIPDLHDGEHLVNWARAWVSRDRQYNTLLSARYRDFVVLTTSRLVLWSCGFFTRRPLHKVFDERRTALSVDAIGAHGLHHLRIEVAPRSPLRFDFGSDGASQEIATALLGLGKEG
jgi:hypothetical protein